MKISASFLGIKNDIENNLRRLNDCDIDYIHLDVMDGVFVSNKTYNATDVLNMLKYVDKPKDVHLMVSDIKKYIDDFLSVNPEFITVHYEAINENTDISLSVINYIKNKGIKAGLAIKPNTDVDAILPLLPYLDLILVMSVEPGSGGQKFIAGSETKIDTLYRLKLKENYKYLIEVDGGINIDTIKLCHSADICVVGSYITSGNYEERVNLLKS